jgi:serine/threonine protein phosphatase PrpC
MKDTLEGTETMASLFQWGAVTDIGKVRSKNEDALVTEAEIGLFGVVDGMGGHPGGDVAARVVAEGVPSAIRRELKTVKTRQPRSLRRWLKRCISEQSRQLCFQGLNEAGLEGMGATLALLLVVDHRAYAANLGDSRIYRLRSRRLTQLSKDHSVVGELLEKGEIGPDEAHRHCARGLLTQYVGMTEEPQPHVRSLSLQPDDRFLLCTDGLTDMVDEEGIIEVLASHEDAQQAAETLVQTANDEGGLDNTTVAVVDWSP